MAFLQAFLSTLCIGFGVGRLLGIYTKGRRYSYTEDFMPGVLGIALGIWVYLTPLS